MWFYILNIFILISYSFFIKDKKKYIIVASIQLFLILALRNNELGVDLNYYNDGFNYIKNLNFSNLLSRLHIIKAAELIYPYKFESGYVILNWIISHLGLSFHFLLIICAAVNTYAFGKFINKFSKMPWLSFVIFCTFGSFSYCFGILRQSLALSIFMLSLINMMDNKKSTSYIQFVLAFLFHRATVIALPLLFLCNKNEIKKSRAVIALIASVVFMTFSKYFYQIVHLIMTVFNQGHYVSRSFQINTLIILLYLLLILVIIFVDFNIIKGDKIFIVSIYALIFSIFLEIMGLHIEILTRAITMYTSFITILIPNTLYIYNKQKFTIFIKLGMVIMLVFYMNYYLKDSEIVPYRIQENQIIFE